LKEATVDIAPNRPAAGFTLLEVMMAMFISAILMVILGNILMSSTRSVDAVVVDSVSDQEIRRSLDRLTDELRTSSSTALTINATGTNHDALALQTPSSFTGSVTWGAVDNGGTWHANWTVRYEVVGGQLVRRVFDLNGIQDGADVLLARGIDNLRAGVKGFRASAVGSVVNVGLRVNKGFRDGKSYTKEYTSSVLLKNS
jgi:prepilin-type N-terminal cleavage/methylation domain-containing protein